MLKREDETETAQGAPCCVQWDGVVARGTTRILGRAGQSSDKHRRVSRGLVAYREFHNRGEFVSNAVPDNTVGELFSRVPNGTALLKFNKTSQQFEPRNVFRRGRWSNPDQTLVPGEGAWLFNPARKPLEVEFTGNWSYGSVHLPSGLSLISSPSPGTIDFTPPQSGDGSVPRGPFASTGIRFNPHESDVIYTFSGRRGGFVHHRFHNGSWDTVPAVDMGESCFVFTLHPRVIEYSGPLPLSPQ